jgi:hypothetical protein
VVSPSGASTTSFPFTSTNLGTSGFSLVDNNSTGPDRRIVTNLYKFAKWSNYNLTVTESLISGWTLSDLSCVETDTITSPAQAQFATTVSFSNRRATIQLEEGENVTCTFRNSSLTPTASTGSISGRVTDSYGRGISGARITILNTSSGNSNVVFTNPFGYYAVNDLMVGDFYFASVSHKRYSFTDDSRAFTMNDDISNLDFVANP